MPPLCSPLLADGAGSTVGEQRAFMMTVENWTLRYRTRASEMSVRGWAERSKHKTQDHYARAHSRAPRALHNSCHELAIALLKIYFSASVSTDFTFCSLPSAAQAVLSPRAGRMTSKC